jgi:radical SAM protein with 4Fe4S-binding SPASM domain
MDGNCPAEADVRRIPRCHIPWQQMVIDSSGEVNPCCYWSAYGNVNPPCGNVNQQPLLEIWNGPVYRNLRDNMARGDLAAAGCANCLALKQGLFMALRFDPDADREDPPASDYARHLRLLRREIAEGAAVLRARPTVISFTLSHACNFRCLHCCQESTRQSRIVRQEAADEVFALLPVLTRIIAGGGEPLFDARWRSFLGESDLRRNPYLEFAITTNGSLVTDEVLAGLDRFKLLAINVSLDGGTPKVFDRIRGRGAWDRVVANLDRLITLVRRKGPPSFVSVSMSVMKANILDTPNLVRFALERGISFGLSPVVSMPVDQTLTCFNDPQTETIAWKEAIREGQGVFRKLTAAASDGLESRSHTHFKVLEDCIPWQELRRPHYRAEGTIDGRVMRATRKQLGEDFLVGFYPAADGQPAECRYYAPLRDGRYVAWLPEGEHSLGFFLRNANPSPHPCYRIRVVRDKDRGRVETVALPPRLSSARRVVHTAASRVLPRWSKRMLKRILAIP